MFGSRWVDTLLWTAVSMWTALGDVVHLFTTPFGTPVEAPVDTSTSATDSEEDEEEEENEGEEEDKEEEDEEAMWKRSALIIASRIVNDTTRDETLLRQHHQDLFELMVSMGILEFATQGYKFKLTPTICVTSIAP